MADKTVTKDNSIVSAEVIDVLTIEADNVLVQDTKIGHLVDKGQNNQFRNCEISFFGAPAKVETSSKK